MKGKAVLKGAVVFGMLNVLYRYHFCLLGSLCRHLSSVSHRLDPRPTSVPPLPLYRQHQVHPPRMVRERERERERFKVCGASV